MVHHHKPPIPTDVDLIWMGVCDCVQCLQLPWQLDRIVAGADSDAGDVDDGDTCRPSLMAMVKVTAQNDAPNTHCLDVGAPGVFSQRLAPFREPTTNIRIFGFLALNIALFYYHVLDSWKSSQVSTNRHECSDFS